MFWFIVLLLVAGAGFYFYQKLMLIEREIRAEQEAEVARSAAASSEAAAPVVETDAQPVQKAQAKEPPAIIVEEREPTVAETPVADVEASTEDEILAAVNNLPGIKQTELYKSFPDVDKKKFQQTVKQLADDGNLKREKEGNSYALFPA